MAIDNQRDVKLNVAVQATGAEAIGGLSGDLRNLAKSGGDAAPAFDKLAAEMDQASAATTRLREAEQQTRNEVAQQKRDLDAKRDALARLNAESTTEKKATDAHKTQV